MEARAAGDTVVLGGDEDFWLQVGIDPVRIMTGAGTFYTLRCYLDDRPIFLGRNGRISVFSSERALARYLADEHDHDLSDLSTYDDIRTAATDGSLAIDITDDNIYVLSGLGDDFCRRARRRGSRPAGPGRRAAPRYRRLLRGEHGGQGPRKRAGRWASSWPTCWSPARRIGKPAAPYSAVVREWEKLEQFVESRLRRE